MRNGFFAARSLRRVFTVGAMAAAILCSSSGWAWDGATTGRVVVIEVTQGANLGFRIWLDPNQQMCSAGAHFAFLYETDSNYKAYVATLLLAKASGSQVSIYTTNEGGYCHIGHVVSA